MGKSLSYKLFLVVILFVVSNSNAQWRNTNFPSFYYGIFNSITIGANGLIFVSTEKNGVFRSTDNGSTWNSVNNGFIKQGNVYDVRQIAINPITSMVFCLSSSSLYTSSDMGEHWIPNSTRIEGVIMTRFRFDSIGNIYIANGINILFSDDNGNTWKVISDGLLSAGQFVQDVQIGPDDSVYAITSGHLSGGYTVDKISILGRPNNKWIALNSPVVGSSPWKLSFNSDNQILTLCGDLYLSTNGGSSWKKIFSDPSGMGIRDLVIDSKGKIFVSVPEQNGLLSYSRIYYSLDNGVSWIKSGYQNQFIIFASDGNQIFASEGKGIIISKDNGNTWKLSNTGFPNSTGINTMAFTHDGTLMVGAKQISPYISKDKGSSWNAIKFGWYYDPYDVIGIAANENGMMMMCAGANGGEGSAYSTDFGVTWNTIHFSSSIPNSCTILPNNNFFVTVSSSTGYSGPVLKKTEGNMFESVTNVAQNESYTCITGTEDNYLFTIYNAYSRDGRSQSNSIRKSIDNGANWTTVYGGWGSTPIKKVVSLCNCGKGLLFAGTDFGVLRSTDYGENWILIDSTKIHFNMMNFVRGKSGEIYTGNASGLFKSLDNGNTWQLVDSVLNVTSLVFDKDGYLFIGTKDKGVFTNAPYQELPENPAGTISTPPEVPDAFSLFQNYPNPFNPSTTITYSIPNVETLHATSLRVMLKIYDVLGREVATLVNESKSPGNYEVKFDGSRLSSGVYFYKLAAGNFMETKKMLLLK
jgi:photosystem II stability/assembly factor-like uncharacterized protein